MSLEEWYGLSDMHISPKYNEYNPRKGPGSGGRDDFQYQFLIWMGKIDEFLVKLNKTRKGLPINQLNKSTSHQNFLRCQL